MRRRPLLVAGVVIMIAGVLAIGAGLVRAVSTAGPERPSPPSVVASTEVTTEEPSTPGPTRAPTTSTRVPTTSSAPTTPAPWSAGTRFDPVNAVRLSVPRMGLSTSVSAHGLDSLGRINPPPGTAMWFDGYDRVQPGRRGTAVIAGHLVWGGQPDIFASLSSLRLGDPVRVADPRTGATLTYVVRRSEAISKDGLTRDQDVWGANSSVSRIALITCDPSLGMRSDGHRVANRVVIAEAR